MRKSVLPILLVIVVFLLTACKPAPVLPDTIVTPESDTADSGEEPVTSTANDDTTALNEAINPDKAHQECTYVEVHNCDIDTSAYENQSDDGASTEETEKTEEAAIMESDYTLDKLLMDFEVIFYQSDFEIETAQFSDVFANGKPTVLVYWAGLCPVCRREMPEIQAAYEIYGDQVNFVGIDVGLFTNLGSKDDALTMIEELGLTYPLGVTLDFNVMSTYEITAVPTTLFMKPDGLIIRKESTLLNQEALFERIDTLLEHSNS